MWKIHYFYLNFYKKSISEQKMDFKLFRTTKVSEKKYFKRLNHYKKLFFADSIAIY